MRTVFRLAIGSAVLAASMAVSVGPAFAGETITVTCTNGFSRTVAAQAARGVAKSLTKFNEFNNSGVTCTAGPGAPRPAATSWLTISCTNGFERTVNAKAAGGIVKALNNFNAQSHTGVTCSAA
jgi:hypothetical protein